VAVSSDQFRRNGLRDAQEFVAVSLKIGLREWAFIIAAACVAVSLFYSAQEVLFNGGSPSRLEAPLSLIATLLILWGADSRMDPTRAKWLSAAAIAVSLLLLGMLIALPGGVPAARFLLGAAAVLVCVVATIKLLGRR
jgi:hypothetical protein